jgi:hypothetical protein
MKSAIFRPEQEKWMHGYRSGKLAQFPLGASVSETNPEGQPAAPVQGKTVRNRKLGAIPIPI